MGTLYVVVPLNEESAAWLDSEGIDHPPLSTSFRNPTPKEIEQVLAALPDYRFEIRRNYELRSWYADVSWALDPSKGPWTEIAVRDYRDDDLPHDFSFTKGWLEIILLVTERLSHLCDPLAIADDSDAFPYLVRPGTPLETMIDQYNAR